MLKDQSDQAATLPSRAGGAAREVLSVLSSELRLIYPDMAPRMLVKYLDQMQSALTQTNPKRVKELLNTMRRAGIRDVDVADYYIPVAARRLGEGWVEDSLEFAEVTVAMANLQTMLHELDASWCMPERAPFGTLGEVCIIVPEGVQHSLGATILAGQIRRAGYDVQMGNGLKLEEIASFVSSPATMGVMVSASLFESLDFLRKVVKKVRSGNPWAPVLIGGNVLERDVDICASVGADHATNDWQAALEYCAGRVQL